MPIYTYQCSGCNHVFDGFHKIDNRRDPESAPCPECKVDDVVKMSVSTVTFNADALPKLSRDYKFLMNSIRKANRGSNMPDY